jgi:hypothetical protein
VTNIDPDALQRAFSLNCEAAATRVRPDPPTEWWLTGVLNLGEIGPIIAAQYRINAVACIKALRDQFPGGNLAALRDFADWCSRQHPA